MGLSPGRYRAEVAATLDGKSWSADAAALEFEVGRPFYLQAWFIVLAAAALGAVLLAGHRARVAVLLRLERQRTRIAMDLHDEMGSGLGSIGILAGMAAQEGLGEKERRALAAETAEAAAELGTALSDLVWSLRPGSATLESLVSHLVERARRLFPAGGEKELRIDVPLPCPGVPLSLAVRRNVFLIGLEALHNAARHSGARRVTLDLAAGVRAPGRGSDGLRGARDDPASDLRRGRRLPPQEDPRRGDPGPAPIDRLGRLPAHFRRRAHGARPAAPRGARASLGRPAALPARLDLSEREQEVLRCLAQGQSYKEIADTLGIQHDTVRSHIRHVYRKRQVHSVTEAVGRAIREGLV